MEFLTAATTEHRVSDTEPISRYHFKKHANSISCPLATTVLVTSIALQRLSYRREELKLCLTQKEETSPEKASLAVKAPATGVSLFCVLISSAAM